MDSVWSSAELAFEDAALCPESVSGSSSIFRFRRGYSHRGSSPLVVSSGRDSPVFLSSVFAPASMAASIPAIFPPVKWREQHQEELPAILRVGLSDEDVFAMAQGRLFWDSITKIQINVWTRDSFSMIKTNAGSPSYLAIIKPGEDAKGIKVWSISMYIDKQTEVIKYFLETMPNLEQVLLYYDTPFDGDLSILSSKLEKAASPKCKILVISDNTSFSFTV